MKLFNAIIAAAAADHSSSSSSSIYEGECGGTITEFQTITSPGFDRGYYYNNLNCVWNIELGDVQGFNIVPISFAVESNYICAYDSVGVIDGNGYERNFCGYNDSSRRRREAEEHEKEGDKYTPDRANPSNEGFPSLFIEGGSAVIVFSTDGSITPAGFEFVLTAPDRLQIIEGHAQVNY